MTQLEHDRDRLRQVPRGTQAWFGAGQGAWLSVGHGMGLRWHAAAPRVTVATVWGEGGCSWTSGAFRGRLGAGGLMVLDPLLGHEGIGDEGSDYAVAWLPPSLLRGADRRPLRFGAQQVGPGHPAAERLVAWAAAVLDQSPTSDVQLAGLVGALTSLAGPPAPVLDPAVLRAREAMAERPDRPLDLATLAQVAELSSFQLVRRFRNAYGLPPHRYLVQLRLQAAIEALGQGRDVTEAAHLAGFADAAHFIRIFRRQNLMSPGAWRRATHP